MNRRLGEVERPKIACVPMVALWLQRHRPRNQAETVAHAVYLRGDVAERSRDGSTRGSGGRIDLLQDLAVDFVREPSARDSGWLQPVRKIVVSSNSRFGFWAFR